jgi:RimJ/RimL family protein N-acetyltransferase
MATPGPLLETGRLILRVPGPEDFAPWAAFAADEETMRHLGGVQARSEAWRGLCQVAGAWTIEGFSMFSVVEKASGRWIGRLGPWRPADWPGTEVGWGIAREFWGRGYATEGAAAALDYAFDVLGWAEVIHCIAPANVASQGVATRLGSRLLRKGRMPPPYDEPEIDIWGQTRGQWRENRQRLRR